LYSRNVCDEYSNDLSIGGVGAGKDLVWGAQHCSSQWSPVRTNKACLPGQVILHQAHCKSLSVPSLFYLFLDSWFGFSWLRRFYPSMFMSKPSLNHVSVIKCSQIMKRCRNASIIGISSLVHGFSNFSFYDPF